jgi:hypothetical protein
MRKLTWTLLLVASAQVVAAQGVDDLDKPLPTECSEATTAREPGPLQPAPELDEWLDLSNASLGFFVPTPDGVSFDKAAGETCHTGEARLPEEPYDKTDDAGRLLAACASPMTLTDQAGVHDNYAAPVDPANLTTWIREAVPTATRWDGFDSSQVNYHFGHTFTPSFTTFFGYRSGKLTLHVRPNGDIYGNDTLSLWVRDTVNNVNLPGWGVALSSLGYTLTPGRDTTIELDLRTLRTANSTILADINRFHNLNVYVQDDTALDDMTLNLACDDSAQPTPLVGVIMERACGSLPLHEVFFDNEDNRNANNRGGWIGATVSNKNTLLRLCAVDGRQFTPAAQAGANFALVSLAKTCPEGFTRFDRFHDNEDNRPASWDSAPNGSPTYTTQPEKNTNMAFCVATGTNPGVLNTAFPAVGPSYGVFGGRTPSSSRWALARGYLFLDDEDRRNRNEPANPPAYTREFLVPGANTTYFLAKVK